MLSFPAKRRFQAPILRGRARPARRRRRRILAPATLLHAVKPIVTVALLTLIAFPAAAAGTPEFGVRSVMVTAGGEPANDIMGFGLYGRFAAGEKWLVGVALDRAEFDFERPAKALGLEQDPALEAIDATAESLALSAWVERPFASSSGRWIWNWTAGLGFAAPDVEDVQGPLAGGGTFDITTDAGTEIIVSITGGVRRLMGEHWALDLGLRVDHHFAEWEVQDRVSGRTTTLDSYTGIGGHFGLAFRF